MGTPEHRHRFAIGEPAVALVIGQQDLAAPERAIIAEAQPVERDAEHRLGHRDLVLRHAGGDMRVVVLHLGEGRSVPFRPRDPPFRRQILGMAIDRHHARHVLEHFEVMGNRASIARCSPQICASTPSPSLPTQPRSPCRCARRQNGGAEPHPLHQAAHAHQLACLETGWAGTRGDRLAHIELMRM